jgi:hypothetical protein
MIDQILLRRRKKGGWLTQVPRRRRCPCGALLRSGSRRHTGPVVADFRQRCGIQGVQQPLHPSEVRDRWLVGVRGRLVGSNVVEELALYLHDEMSECDPSNATSWYRLRQCMMQPQFDYFPRFRPAGSHDTVSQEVH